MAEVRRREPDYTSLFPITVSHKSMASNYRQHPVCAHLPAGVVEKALVEGLAYVAGEWPHSDQPTSVADPMAQFICDSIVDAFCADQGLLALQPHNGCRASTWEILEQEYTERRTTGGMSYWIRRKGSRPLLLVNATGTPIAIWNKFLADPTHDFKIILPRRRGTDIHKGGLQQCVPISTESADFASILDTESIAKADVLGWCNGAKIAIDFVNSRPDQISSMVLLGPMLKGTRRVAPNPSSFERDLQPLLDAVAKQPALAPAFCKAIAQSLSKPPDWERWTKAPGVRANTLFAMPAREHAYGVTAPIGDPQSLINIAQRVASDETYPTDDALEKLKTRTMVILGSHDNVVSNALVTATMKQMCDRGVLKVSLTGSGHYIHDLQYHYFRSLLTEFIEGQQTPSATARISIETLSPHSR